MGDKIRELAPGGCNKQRYHWQLSVIVRTLALKDWVVSEGYLGRELMLAA